MFTRALGGGQLLDLPVAALAGIAVAFAAVAVPAEAIERLVEASSLPALLSAAEPPLGAKARVALAAGGALIVFLLVFALLRRLDGGGRRAAAADEESEAETPPRLRRRDFHPDAPPRPPLLVRELGEPEDAAAPDRPEPPAEESGELVLPAWIDPPPSAETEPEGEPWPAPAAAEAPPSAPVVEEERPAPPPQAFVAEAPRPVEAHSIAELIERLERGLSRRGAAPRSPPAAAAAPVFPAPADDRLQSAIDSLQRLAARQN